MIPTRGCFLFVCFLFFLLLLFWGFRIWFCGRRFDSSMTTNRRRGNAAADRSHARPPRPTNQRIVFTRTHTHTHTPNINQKKKITAPPKKKNQKNIDDVNDRRRLFFSSKGTEKKEGNKKRNNNKKKERRRHGWWTRRGRWLMGRGRRRAPSSILQDALQDARETDSKSTRYSPIRTPGKPHKTRANPVQLSKTH